MQLNYTAVQDYARHGQYEQAQKIYEFIYAHPYYVSPHTRIHHGLLLTKMGRQEEANLVLSHAGRDIRKLTTGNGNTSENHRWLGIIFSLMNENEKAEEEFSEAIRMDQTALDHAHIYELRAHLLWSIGKTLEAQGDMVGTIQKVKEALATKPSIVLNGKLKKWLRKIKKLNDSSKDIDALNYNLITRLIKYPNEFKDPSTIR